MARTFEENFRRALAASGSPRRKDFKGADKEAYRLVRSYVQRYIENRGLSASMPRIAVGMMRTIHGWPVRNADGGDDISYFTTDELAQKAIRQSEREVMGR